MIIINQGTPPTFDEKEQARITCECCESEMVVLLGECEEKTTWRINDWTKRYRFECPVCKHILGFKYDGKKRELIP